MIASLYNGTITDVREEVGVVSYNEVLCGLSLHDTSCFDISLVCLLSLPLRNYSIFLLSGTTYLMVWAEHETPPLLLAIV